MWQSRIAREWRERLQQPEERLQLNINDVHKTILPEDEEDGENFGMVEEK